MKVLLINGSPRISGNTFQMLNKAIESLKSNGISTELIQLREKNIKGCTGCFKCAINKDKKCVVKLDDFNEVFAKMIEADGIIIGSPTYFTDVTTEVKSILDRSGAVAFVNNGLFRHKAGAAVIALRRGGGVHAFDTINHMFLMNQMFVVGSTYWNLGFGLNEGDVQNDTEGLANMEDLANSMAFLLKKLKDQ
ncbi:MAG: flavodoxin family protein [Candidatus Omnitrophica bacterium]|nr:flavodoxin family protein [Candidatus Omnitrophota bacterium]MBU1997174.1 flavodoxin family protein [Candidatus Omnitrophota bacterium]MBU4334182.1 flavodoxin family protein [Candidatus Omnitrophota bacterium]